MNVVCVFAHQDDELTCVATLLRLKREHGDSIAFVALTNGENGAAWDPDRPHEDVIATRAGEMQAVADALDARYICLEQPDGLLFDGPEIRLALIEALRVTRAQLVFTHPLRDYHLDHEATARLTCLAALQAEIASVRTASAALPSAPAIFHVDPGDGYGFETTHFVAYDQELADEKARIGRLHASQMEVMRALRGRDYADLALDADRQRGARLVVPYAEGFRPCLMERRIPTASLLP